jgi:long-chain fatty acid transport protein
MSVGVSLNLNYQQVAFQQRFQVDTGAPTGPDTTVVNFDLARGAQAFGYGLSVGILFDVSEQLTLGASYKSKQLFPEMEYQLGFGDIQNVATPTGTPLSNCPVVGSNQICPAGRYELDLDYPQQIAAGLAYEFGPRWSVSADLKWIEWSDTLNEIVISGPNGTRVLLPAGWDDQVVYAVGVEFSPSDRLSLRAGYNYSESPIGDEDVDNNYILPGVVESHYTLGADYALNNRWALGFHYMYAPEVTFKSPVTNAEIGLSEQSVGVNIGYNF